MRWPLGQRSRNEDNEQVAMHIGKDAVSIASAVGPLLRSGLVITSIALGSVPDIARADEGGVSFWIPGFFGSLAAVPGTPGWSVTEIYYHDSVSAGADVARARVIELGRIPGNVTLNANLNASVNANVNLGFVNAAYIFATPVLGGQASVSMFGAYGNNSTSLAAALTGTATGPGGATSRSTP